MPRTSFSSSVPVVTSINTENFICDLRYAITGLQHKAIFKLSKASRALFGIGPFSTLNLYSPNDEELKPLEQNV